MKRTTGLVMILMLAIACLACSKEEKKEAVAEPQTALAMDGGYALEAGKIKLFWHIVEKNINIKLSAPTAGWVGIGFNPAEEMKDANFIIGYVKDGEVKVIDHHGSGKRQHRDDIALGGTDNVTGATGSESDGVTEIGFSLPLQTGDSLDGSLQPAADTIVLLAFGMTDRLAQQHVHRARLKLNLANGKYQILMLE